MTDDQEVYLPGEGQAERRLVPASPSPNNMTVWFKGHFIDIPFPAVWRGNLARQDHFKARRPSLIAAILFWTTLPGGLGRYGGGPEIVKTP
jgi:hypothetical protein